MTSPVEAACVLGFSLCIILGIYLLVLVSSKRQYNDVRQRHWEMVRDLDEGLRENEVRTRFPELYQ